MAIKISNTTVIDDSRQFIPGAISAGSTTGTSGQVLKSTGTGVEWGTASGGGDFNTGITNVSQLSPVSYETTVFTFPSTAGIRYIIESINVSNVYSDDINVIGALNFSGGNKVHFAYNNPIVQNSSVELLRQPHVANPSDFITMWTNDVNYYGVGNTVTGSAAEVYMTYTAIADTNYFGVGLSTVGIAATGLVGIFTSTTYPSVIESIHVVNRTDNGDFPVSIQITNGTSTSYLARDLLVPRYATVEICDMPKRVNLNGVIRVAVGITNTIDVSISGKKIAG